MLQFFVEADFLLNGDRVADAISSQAQEYPSVRSLHFNRVNLHSLALSGTSGYIPVAHLLPNSISKLNNSDRNH